MGEGSTAAALRQIGTLFGSGPVAGMTDGELLARFLGGRDEGSEVAFAALVARHGPMVLGVCRRALADPGDAEDAFQATFLILVRKARSVRVDDSLGRWLYGVSRRVAARARAVAARRPRLESGALGEAEARSPDPDRFEVRATLDEELARLPGAYRSAIVLCDLGGLTHEEAARDLGCPVGTIKSRLARGRARLRASLERRGLAPSIRTAAPMVPARLAEAAVRSSTALKVGGASAAGLVPASAVALAEGMLKAMTGIQWKLAAAAVLSIGVAATGAGVMARQKEGDAKPPAPSTPDARTPRPGVAPGDQPREFRKVVMPSYVVEPPDLIKVEVLEALPGRPITGERLVRPDGKINLGYYGEVYVAGLTTSEIKAKVALHLRQYLDDKALGLSRENPEAGKLEPVPPAQSNRVMVDVIAYNSKVYYVQGDVGVPGRLPITGNETVLDAINYAGGLIPTASKAIIRLVRPAPPGAGGEQVLPVNLSAIIEAGDPATNYQIMPGDRLVVSPDPKVVPGPTAPTDIEARLQAVERKLDEVLKALERISKP